MQVKQRKRAARQSSSPQFESQPRSRAISDSEFITNPESLSTGIRLQDGAAMKPEPIQQVLTRVTIQVLVAYFSRGGPP